MFISSNSLNALHNAFQMCDNPKTVKQAESALAALACNPYYPRLLIDYCVNYPKQALRAAIEFKAWASKSSSDCQIQQDLVQVYLHLESPVSYHICLAIVTLAPKIGISEIVQYITASPFSQKGLYLLYKISKNHPDQMRQ